MMISILYNLLFVNLRKGLNDGDSKYKGYYKEKGKQSVEVGSQVRGFKRSRMRPKTRKLTRIQEIGCIRRCLNPSGNESRTN